MKRKLYVIEWTDAVFSDEDAKFESEFKPENVISVGWLIREQKDHVVICMEYGEDGWVRRRLAIPRDMITKMTEWT